MEKPFTPLHSAVSVLKDIRNQLEETLVGDDLTPSDIEGMLVDINAVFDIDDVKAILAEFEKSEQED